MDLARCSKARGTQSSLANTSIAHPAHHQRKCEVHMVRWAIAPTHRSALPRASCHAPRRSALVMEAVPQSDVLRAGFAIQAAQAHLELIPLCQSDRVTGLSAHRASADAADCGLEPAPRTNAPPRRMRPHRPPWPAHPLHLVKSADRHDDRPGACGESRGTPCPWRHPDAGLVPESAFARTWLA